MASLNYATREIGVKIVYYGPGLSGKTTNLQVIHRKIPPEYKSDMVSLATETDRTLFFDFLPLDLGKIKGFSTKFQLYTVPGQVYYNATRKLVLRGVDGIVFVADSAPDKMEENHESFRNLEENLAEYGYQRENIPIVLQYNKRDLPNALSIEELDRQFNRYNLPRIEGIANKGKGVFEALKLISKIVIDELNKRYSRPTASSAAGRPAPAPQRPVPQSAPLYQQPVAPPPQEYAPPQSMVQPVPQQFAQPVSPPPNQGANSYGNITFEPTAAQFQSQPVQPVKPAPVQFPQISTPQSFSQPGMHTELDLEIERYQREIEEKQRKTGYLTGVPTQQPAPQPQNLPPQTSYIPTVPPQQSVNQYAATFEPPSYTQQPQEYQMPPVQQQSYQQPQPGYQEPGYAQPQPATQGYDQNYQYTQPPMPEQAAEAGDENSPMYFTSVNTDRVRNKKKPVNPKSAPQKGLISRFFNRDSDK